VSRYGWRLEVHDSLPSTSDACIARAEAGEAAGLAILALRQTAGRGSRGRGWTEPPAGNLAITVLLRPEGLLADVAVWPFLAGLALHEALSADLVGGSSAGPLMLKWPNDMMLGGGKLAGILIERGVGGPDGQAWLSIGFGANLAQAPAIPGRRIACLAELGEAPAPMTVARRLLVALDRWQDLLLREGFESIRHAWLARAHPVGTLLSVMQRGDAYEGTFDGIAPDGALRLLVEGEIRLVRAGDVLLPTCS